MGRGSTENSREEEAGKEEEEGGREKVEE